MTVIEKNLSPKNILLLKSGFAGILHNMHNPDKTAKCIVDRRRVLYAKPIKENRLLGIPHPQIIKRLYRGRVCSILETGLCMSAVTLSVFIKNLNGDSCWVHPDELKNYNYKPKKIS